MYPVTWKTLRYRSLQKSSRNRSSFFESFDISHSFLGKSLQMDAEQFFGTIIPYMSFMNSGFFGLNYGIICPENVDV